MSYLTGQLLLVIAVSFVLGVITPFLIAWVIRWRRKRKIEPDFFSDINQQ